jgi:vacuolar protein sorting-associated protein 45
MLALKGTRANICWAKDDQKMTLCQELAQGIKTEISSDGGPGDTLIVLLDRRFDPITPLLNQWTYQAMVHELIGMNNNRVDLTGREEVPAEMQNLTLSGDSDEFYRLNMYANFGEIGEAIQTLVKNFQDKKGNMGGKLDSISDIKDFITNYPEFKKMSGTVSKHVALVTELSKEVTANNLCKISELEQNIACGQERDNSMGYLLEFLKMENIRKKDALRLIALFTIRYENEVQKNTNVLCKSVRGMYVHNSCFSNLYFHELFLFISQWARKSKKVQNKS